MQTRLYSDLFAMIMSLTGQSFSVSESVLIKNLVNRRAQIAYRSSNYWPRFLILGEERVVTDAVVPFSETGLPTIDTFIKIHQIPPYIGGGSQEIKFTTNASGANLLLFENYTGSAYVTYKAILSSIYGDNSNEEDDIPSEWFNYIAFGVYADYLKREGLQDRAVVADQEAMMIMEDELSRIDMQSFISPRILTHSNMVNRNGYGKVITNILKSDNLVLTELPEQIETEG